MACKISKLFLNNKQSAAFNLLVPNILLQVNA